MNIHEMIMEKSKELATEHARIIENECFLACEKYNCTLDDLIINYHNNLELEIHVKASHFKLINNFVYEKGVIKNESNNKYEFCDGIKK